MTKVGYQANTTVIIVTAITVLLGSWLIFWFTSPSFVEFTLTDTLGDPGETDPVRCLVFAILCMLASLLLLYAYNSCCSSFKW